MAFHPARSTPKPPNSITMPQLNTQQGDVTKANLGTATPQVMGGTNPVSNANRLSMAAGGSVPAPPTPDDIKVKTASVDQNKARELAKFIDPKQLGTDIPKSSSDKTEEMFKQYENKDYQAARSKLTGPMASGQDDTKAGYATGGSVDPSHDQIKNMPLKDIIKMLASHPDMAQGMPKGMATGGMADKVNITPRGNKAAMVPNGNKAAALKKSTHQGLLNTQSNVNVGTYATGGDVNDLEEDQITGYGPDGTPEIDNADGSSGYGDINSLLGRPANAPTLGTGQTPVTGISKNASNSISSSPEATTQMAKGGEENGPPPGSLKDEVADNVDAKLSPGEWVASADTVRFWGLKFFNELQEHARQELAKMNATDQIRHPGDGKNPDEGGQFMQDQKPNTNAYMPQEMGKDDDSDGILKECLGGMNYAAGGDIMGEEDTYANGGEVAPNRQSDGNSTADENSVSMYDKGGVVTSAGPSLTPKKIQTAIPGVKTPKMDIKGPKTPNSKSYGLAKFNTKMKKGGLLEGKLQSDAD